MLDYRYENLVTWPGTRTPGWEQRDSPFRMTWGQSLDELEREIRALRGTNVVFKVAISNQKDLRNDGRLRENAKFAGSGVIVEFTAEGVDGAPRLSYPCDTFKVIAANVRAIAGVLEGLRRADRYGVKTSMGAALSTEAAAEIIATESGRNKGAILQDPDAAKSAVRIAISATHPDRHQGDRTRYDRVDRARAVLASLHGVSL